jgi:hypothetical protein
MSTSSSSNHSGHRQLLLRVSAATAAVALAAAVAITTADAGGPAAGGAGPAQEVLHFRVLFSPQDIIDVPPRQRHLGDYRPGDYTVFSDVLTNRTGTRVGTEGGAGLITRVGPRHVQIQYSLTIRLPLGQIVAQGLASPEPSKHLAIIGGTRSYSGARGRLDLVEHRNNTGRLTLTLRP